MDSSVVERHSDLIDPITIDQRLNQNQKINLNTVVVTETQETTELIETQYINLHRLPENLQKVQLVTDSLSNDLLSQQVVELTAGNDFIAPVTGQFYEDEFLHHDLTEEDRRLAAALVAVQLVQQQKHSILAPELLKSTTLPPLAPMQNVSAEKQPVTSSMVTSYLQGFDEDDDSVPQQLIDATQSPERLLKIYHTQSVSTAPLSVNTSSAALSDIRLPALPPLKKVLSNPSIMRNRYDRTLSQQVHEEIDDKDLIIKSPDKEEKVELLHSDNSGDLMDNEGESDFDGDCNLKSSKRSLPHKKRIPRKLKSQPTKNNTKYKCQKCGDAFVSHAALMSHRSTHQVPAKRTSVFACEICGFQNNNQVRFFEHLKGHYEPSVLQVTDVLQQQDSFIEYEAETNATPIIQETFSIKESPEQASVSNFSCNQCGRTFRRQKTFDAHIATAHPPLEEFSEPEDMMEGIRHVVNIQTAEDEKDESLRNWRLSDDLNNLHPDIVLDSKGTSTEPIIDDLQDADTEKEKKRKKSVQCPHCSKTFTHRNSLLYHVRSHSGRRPHQCDVCGKGFFAANALRVHMRMHSGDKPYTCTVCGRNFRQWGDLKYHMTSLHSDTKQYQCEFCGKDFARKIHTGEKPYNCDVCHKPFRVKSDMKRHRNTHNKGRTDVVPVPQPPGSPETILPDNPDTESMLTDHSLPLNLNMRQDSSDDLTSYSRDALSRENTLYVWIPASGESILPD
ncbi:hypothetical protein GE061_000449 [Apolygus lucorum]|uniref:C2H2-type domain-containing protein n=1 Tax=Apolygus lucorum TaxID=248454 RepID=A0A6A4K088_APOLU|nr:hypothetical protein GE061_000449 [Apolygus lucorum]